ncbi:hypothetical protein VP1G_10510 [Cytospora mali]|uniref:Uncharacterized protein n=1 Tax=Cytospora mali TaxID=578113 RepID=A0A194UNR5_CYTMA|nr:hypothetical protein VP1G_10510 [Valsa mali var. pyri (nom. inval.)]
MTVSELPEATSYRLSSLSSSLASQRLFTPNISQNALVCGFVYSSGWTPECSSSSDGSRTAPVSPLRIAGAVGAKFSGTWSLSLATTLSSTHLRCSAMSGA